MFRRRTLLAPVLPTLLVAAWLALAPPAQADAGTTFTLNSSSIAEGPLGTTTDLVFTVTLGGTPITSNASVTYLTNNAGGADAPGDFAITSGLLTFTPGGPTSLSFSVPVVGDGWYEDDETVPILLDNPVNGQITQMVTDGTILNDDPIPSITIGDHLTSEGAVIVLPVTLSNLSQKTVTVDYTTVAGSATADDDYTTSSGTLTFQAIYAQSIVIPTAEDTDLEADETFTVVLSNPAEATIADGTGVATIQDDDEAVEQPVDPPETDPESPPPPDKGDPFPEVPAVPEVPVTDDPADPPAVDDTTAAAPESEPEAVSAVPAEPVESLPRTGASTLPVGAAGLGLLLFGVVLRRSSVRIRDRATRG